MAPQLEQILSKRQEEAENRKKQETANAEAKAAPEKEGKGAGRGEEEAAGSDRRNETIVTAMIVVTPFGRRLATFSVDSLEDCLGGSFCVVLV